MILLGRIYHVRTLSEKLVRRSEDMLAVLPLHGCDLKNAMNFLALSVGQLRKALEAVMTAGFYFRMLPALPAGPWRLTWALDDQQRESA